MKLLLGKKRVVSIEQPGLNKLKAKQVEQNKEETTPKKRKTVRKTKK
jgi:hypothetical protein